MKKRLYRVVLGMILACVPMVGSALEYTLSSEMEIAQLFEKGENEHALKEVSKLLLAGENLSPSLEEKMLVCLADDFKTQYILGYANTYKTKSTMTEVSRILIAWAACPHGMFDMASEYLEGLELGSDTPDDMKSRFHSVHAMIYADKKAFSKAIEEALIAEKYRPSDLQDEFILAHYYMKIGDKGNAVKHIKKVPEKYKPRYLQILIQNIGSKDFFPLHCDEAFIETYLFSANVLFGLGGFIETEKSEIETDLEDFLWITIYNTGARIYAVNRAAANPLRADSILKAFKTIEGQGFNFYLTAVNEVLEQGGECDSALQPLGYILRMHPKLDKKSKRTVREQLRLMLECHVDQEPTTVDVLNITWFYNTGEWIFDEAFSGFPAVKDGVIDKTGYEKVRQELLKKRGYLEPDDYKELIREKIKDKSAHQPNKPTEMNHAPTNSVGHANL